MPPQPQQKPPRPTSAGPTRPRGFRLSADTLALLDALVSDAAATGRRATRTDVLRELIHAAAGARKKSEKNPR